MEDATRGEAGAPVDEHEAEKIQRILAAVRQDAKDQFPDPAVTGLVVGGDEQELQVAIRTGVVGLPVAQIRRIVHPIPTREDIATFYLDDLEAVRTILPVMPLRAAGADFLGGPRDPATGDLVMANAGTTFTHTSVAGESMTAGEVAGVNSDDCEVHSQNDDSLD